MMTIFKRIPIFQTLMVALALTPAAIFVFLGTFSRLQDDDFCVIARGQEMGAWDYMTYKLDTWAGSYANWFLKGALAPLDTMAVRIMPALIAVLWLFGLFWLVDEGLAHLKISHWRRPLALAMAALGVAGAINGSHAHDSFYYYAASTHYTLPLPLLTIYLALTVWLTKRTRLPAWGLIAGGLLCFITAGAAEVFLVFQLTFLTLCLLVCFVWRRRVYARVLGVGWLAALVSLMIQLNTPGVARRAVLQRGLWRGDRPNDSPLALLFKIYEEILKALGHPPIFAGFVLLMAVGLLVMLFACWPPQTLKTSKPAKLVPSAWWLCLIFQLLWLPILWGQVSANPQFFGRFSLRYMVVIVLNLTFILGFAVLLWQRKRINAYLQRHERGLPIFCNALLLIFAALFALSQLSSIHYRAASWLFLTALMFLGLLCWQLSSLLSVAETRKIGLLALCSLGMGLACMAAVVGVGTFGRGYTPLRVMTPAAYLLTFSGLVWGAYLGCLVKHLPSRYDQAWITRLKLAGLAAMLIIGLGIVLGQAALTPDFQRHAREWEARHLDIIAQRGRGQTVIEVAPFSFSNRPDYIGGTSITANFVQHCVRLYYSVDSIVVRDG